MAEPKGKPPVPGPKYKIDPKKAALVVHDMAVEWNDPNRLPGIDVICTPIKKLIEACRTKGILIIYTSLALRDDGRDMGRPVDVFPGLADDNPFREGRAGEKVIPDLKDQPGDIIIKKRRYSAFAGTDLDMIFRGRGIDTIIYTGVAIFPGVIANIIDAMLRDYKVICAYDATATPNLPDKGWGPVTYDEVKKVVFTGLAAFVADLRTADDITQEINKA